MSRRISVEFIFRYLSLLGEKTASYKRNNIVTKKTEAELIEDQQDLVDLAAEEYSIEVEANQTESLDEEAVYLFEVVDPFAEKDEGKETVKELIDAFCEKIK